MFLRTILTATVLFLSAPINANPLDPSDGACDATVNWTERSACRRAYRARDNVESIQHQLDSSNRFSWFLTRLLASAESRLARLERRYERLTGGPVPGFGPASPCDLPIVRDWFNQSQLAIADGADAGIVTSTTPLVNEYSNTCAINYEFTENRPCGTLPYFTIIAETTGATTTYSYEAEIGYEEDVVKPVVSGPFACTFQSFTLAGETPVSTLEAGQLTDSAAVEECLLQMGCSADPQ